MRLLLAILLVVVASHAYGAEAHRVRPSPNAGTWYPGTRAALERTINTCVEQAPAIEAPSKPLAFIMPHAGYRYCGKVAGSAARLLEPGAFDRVIVLGPSHRAFFRGASVPTYTHYATPLGNVELDADACRALRSAKGFASRDEYHAFEHSIENLLPWLQARLVNFKFVPILVGEVSAEEAASIAAAIRPFVNDKTLLVASSDFVHYGRRFNYVSGEPDTAAFIQQTDFGAEAFIKKLDPAGFLTYCRQTGATICGRKGIAVLLNLTPRGAEVRRLAYVRSGDETGDYSSSVSYLAVGFFAPPASGRASPSTESRPATRPAQQGDAGKEPAGNASRPNSNPDKAEGDKLTDKEQKFLLFVARNTLMLAATRQQRLEITKEDIPKDLPHIMQRRGVFVTLRKGGKLRGCIGNIEGRSPLVIGTRDKAIDAAFRDPRFVPVRSEELKEIHIEISVLTPLKRVKNPEEIVMGRHGVLLRKGNRSGVFLPQVATETGWTRKQFLENLCSHKAGLPKDAWLSPDTELYTFEAQVFEEPKTKGAQDK